MRRFAQDCDPPTYSCTSRGRKDAKIAHIKSGVRLTRNPTRFASHVAHQNVRQNRFAITVQQLHIRVTHYRIRTLPVEIATKTQRTARKNHRAVRSVHFKTDLRFQQRPLDLRNLNDSVIGMRLSKWRSHSTTHHLTPSASATGASLSQSTPFAPGWPG